MTNIIYYYPIHYFCVSYSILVAGQQYGSGICRVRSIDPKNNSVAKTRNWIEEQLRKHNKQLHYHLIAFSRQITKREYEQLQDAVSFFNEV